MQIPSCTYRVQLNAQFTFSDLEKLLPYLHELGVSTIYASPITTAARNSTHGYDVVNPLAINPEIGTLHDLEKLAGKLKSYGMNWLQDIVPNHMAYDDANSWLHQVLEKGTGSPYYSFFDIEQIPGNPGAARQPLLAPFLGDSLDNCLQRGEIRLCLIEDGLSFCYFDQKYPVTATTIARICPNERSYHREMEDRLRFINRQPDLLKELLQEQYYELAPAGQAATGINYRRFFTVNSLICLRMEDEKVFNTYHKLIFDLYQKGYIQALRIDHIDGLSDPRAYIDRVKQLFGKDCYLVAEKILAPEENLPADWDLEGTTGYEFLFLVNQVLTDPDGSRRLLDFYQTEIVHLPSYEDLLFREKHDFLLRYMGGELDNLLRLLAALHPRQVRRPDSDKWKQTLAVVMASLPVYRLYPEEEPWLTETALSTIQTAFSRARERGKDYLSEITWLEGLFHNEENPAAEDLRFISRLMQFTGPLAAKGIEDTSFYIYNPYIAHNEVGDSPAIAGISAASFHRRMLDRQTRMPYSLNATTTHDTKRGEDSRIRLNWLTAIPGQWIEAVRRWRDLNQSQILHAGDRRIPSPNDEYFIYQSLLGALPEDGEVSDDFRERCHQFLTKALREAKTETHYENPDQEYEEGCHNFLKSILRDASPFLNDFLPFARQVIKDSGAYVLTQLLIKLTAPGIPDIYQGAECAELSLVDPDNRRPVDYAMRQSLLRQVKEGKKMNKLFLLHKTLQFRRRHPLLFTEGEYLPVSTSPNWLSYIRKRKGQWVLVFVPLIRQIQEDSAPLQIRLPEDAPRKWTCLLTEEAITLSEDGTALLSLLAGFPAALLCAMEEQSIEPLPAIEELLPDPTPDPEIREEPYL